METSVDRRPMCVITEVIISFMTAIGSLELFSQHKRRGTRIMEAQIEREEKEGRRRKNLRERRGIDAYLKEG